MAQLTTRFSGRNPLATLSPSRPASVRRRDRQQSLGKLGADVVKGAYKSLDTIDKLHEAKLAKSGLLSESKWTSTYVKDMVGGVPQYGNVDMFTRAPGAEGGILNPVRFVKDSTRSSLDRIAVNTDLFDTTNAATGELWTATDVAEKLYGQGYTNADVIKVMQNTKGIEIIPHDMPGIQAGGAVTDVTLQPNVIVDESLTYAEWTKKQEALNSVGTVDKFKVLNKLSFKGSEFAKDLDLLKDAALSGVSEFGADVVELGKAVASSGRKLGEDIVEEVSEHVPEAVEKSLQFIESATGKTAEAAGKVAGATADVAKAGLKIGGKILGTAATVGSVVSGIKRGASGLKKTGESIKDVDLAGIWINSEEAVQGAIDVASPFLLKSGPIGWVVVGASMAEDLLIDPWMDPLMEKALDPVSDWLKDTFGKGGGQTVAAKEMLFYNI